METSGDIPGVPRPLAKGITIFQRRWYAGESREGLEEEEEGESVAGNSISIVHKSCPCLEKRGVGVARTAQSHEAERIVRSHDKDLANLGSFFLAFTAETFQALSPFCSADAVRVLEGEL